MAYRLENYKILGFYQSFCSLPGLYVAIESSPGKFKAYGDNSIPKESENEPNILHVAKYGMKLSKERAAVLFSDISKKYQFEG